MIICGASPSISMLHLYKLSPLSSHKLLSQFRPSFSFSNSSSSFYFTPNRNFSTAASVAINNVNSNGNKSETDTFFADDAVSWTSLGLSDRISNSLSNAGFLKPSLIQAASVPSILSGNDVVVAAETGSGKTLTYLVPLMDKLCTASAVDSNEATTDQESSTPYMLSLVLCPNVLLCEQVVRMATALRGDDGEPLLKVAAVCGAQGWPVDKLDILVSTPAALLNSINPKKHKRLDFIRDVKHVVFDEADMLLCGSFQNQVIRLINMFRFDEKVLSRMTNAKVENLTEIDSCSSTPDDLEDDGLQNEYNSEDDEISEGEAEVDELEDKPNDGSIKKSYWRRVREVYKRSKQYVFVAATLPVNGKQTAGGLLKKMFPDAGWVSGSFLHRHNPRLEQRWIEVSIETQVDALIQAVKQGSKTSNEVANRTMVFANTVEAVEAVATLLERSSIVCYHYHKDISLEERSKTLNDFGEEGGVLVCTDAASRGVDIPNVSHVIQADFATSAVDFLHRVGRTGRAGQYGLVTSMYTESSRDLVDAIRQAWKSGQPVETAFSTFLFYSSRTCGYNGVFLSSLSRTCIFLSIVCEKWQKILYSTPLSSYLYFIERERGLHVSIGYWPKWCPRHCRKYEVGRICQLSASYWGAMKRHCWPYLDTRRLIVIFCPEVSVSW